MQTAGRIVSRCLGRCRHQGERVAAALRGTAPYPSVSRVDSHSVVAPESRPSTPCVHTLVTVCYRVGAVGVESPQKPHEFQHLGIRTYNTLKYISVTVLRVRTPTQADAFARLLPYEQVLNAHHTKNVHRLPRGRRAWRGVGAPSSQLRLERDRGADSPPHNGTPPRKPHAAIQSRLWMPQA